MDLQVGDRIKFRPTHAKDLELSGEVKAIDEDLLDVLSDESNGSVSRIYSVHVNDCTVIAEEAPAEE